MAGTEKWLAPRQGPSNLPPKSWGDPGVRHRTIVVVRQSCVSSVTKRCAKDGTNHGKEADIRRHAGPDSGGWQRAKVSISLKSSGYYKAS
jgi:hypothetical protein